MIQKCPVESFIVFFFRDHFFTDQYSITNISSMSILLANAG